MAVIKIGSQAYEYLVGQNGDLSHFAAKDRDRFLNALRQKTTKATDLIKQHRAWPSQMLNIGSGVGLVEVDMIRSTDVHCTMIDGEDAGPVCVKSRVPHCSRAIVNAFMKDNEISIHRYAYYNPQDLPQHKFDLVVSFGSWCFHYPPNRYLDYVMKHLKTGGFVIVDVRARHGDWMNDLAKHLRVIEKHATDDKYVRTVLRRV